MGNESVTLRDVARLGGVSVGSASNALSNPDSVRPATREKVFAAAKALGYVPNRAARALAGGRSNMIGVLLPSLSAEVWSTFAQAAQQAAAAQGFQVIVTTDDYGGARCIESIESLIQHGVDGLIISVDQIQPAILELLGEAGVPYIFLLGADGVKDVPSVSFAQRSAAQAIVRHLRGLGHTAFGLIATNPRQNGRSLARINAIRQAVREAGCAMDDDRIFLSAQSITGGQQGLNRLVASKHPPTAIIGAIDLLAAGALVEAVRLGIRVPEDISICGVHDFSFSALMRPALTTVRYPVAEMGLDAVNLVLNAVRSGQPVAPFGREWSGDLIARDSTGPAPVVLRRDDAMDMAAGNGRSQGNGNADVSI